MPLLRPALPQRIKTSPTPSSYEPQNESDGCESMPPSPASATSDASTGSWSKMSQISRGPPAIRRHPEYYIDSGDVVFQVETYLFKVHRYFFVRESQKFKTMLHAPARSGNNTAAQLGLSDACAIELRDVTAKEFCRFLWVFYNPEYSYSASVSKWSSILRLAHLWSFPQIKDLAIREMDKLDICPVDKAVMAREFDVDPQRMWLETAYAALGVREQPLTKEEGTRLGLDVVLLLAEVREKIRTRRRKEQNEARKNVNISERNWFLQPPPPLLSAQPLENLQQHAPPQLYDANPDSAPPSPVGSEDSYDDPQMVQSTYLPPRPPGPPSQIPPYFDPNANMSQSGSSSSMNRHSLTTPASSSSSQHHHHHHQYRRDRDCASPATKSYTEEDVSDVKSVFAP